MIAVDDRTGSVELADCLRAMHLEVKVKRLAFGGEYGNNSGPDFLWEGNGPHGVCTVAVERKRLRDILSCIEDGRLVNQLGGMINTYGFCYLIVEGRWAVDTKTLELIEPCKDGWQPVRLGPKHWFAYQDLDNYLNTIATQSSCRVKISGSPAETVAQLVDLYHWWRDKKWDEHQSLKVLCREPPRFSFYKPNLVQRMAAELPGIGYEKSAAVAARFKTVTAMVLASAQDWMEIPGIGDGIAGKVTKLLYEGEKENG